MQRAVRILPAAVLMVLGAAFLWADQKKTADKPSPFVEVVEKHFAEWDRDKDGKLSPQEITYWIASTAVKEEQAAAVAAIHAFQRSHKEAPALTKDELSKLAKKPEAEERRDQARKLAHLEGDFKIFHGHLQRTPRELFVDNKPPRLEGMSQGNLGDCYWVSTVGAAVQRSGESVQRMIKPVKDRGYEVYFGHGVVVHVPPLTDAEIVLSSSAGSQGVWLNVLEKAFGTEEIQKSRKNQDATALDKISHGGAPSHAIEVMTGHQAETVELRHKKNKESHPADAREMPMLLARLRAALQECLAARGLTLCATGTYKLPPGVPSDHAYAVLHFDRAKDTVTIWNPWGNHFAPKGEAGLEHGYEVKGGVFTVPLKEFVEIFEEVYFETAKPVRVKR